MGGLDMKNETLELIKKDALYKMNETNSFNARVERIYELEKDEKVKEYSELLKSIIGIPRTINLTQKDIYELAFRQHASDILPDDSNGIYVCMGTFAYDVATNFYYKVLDGNVEPLYKKYQDIELGNVLLIELSKTEEFESSNIVINKDDVDAVNLYGEVQWEFIQEAINSDQDSAIKLVHKKYLNND